MFIYIVQDELGNIVATLPDGEFETQMPGLKEPVTVHFKPLPTPGQRNARIELPEELAQLESPADRHAALADYELMFGQATLLRRENPPEA